MPEVQRFRKKAPEIEAIRFDGTNHNEINAFTNGQFEAAEPPAWLGDPRFVATVYNQRYRIQIPVRVGMWIARDTDGFYPIRAEKIADEYEVVGEQGAGGTA
ncbi:hypothetical protein Caci_3028 [Catenulispora acidiphila DSM 44928]|uniref:Uncharacterized protein n=1 Tax=Catenulispora acidiphila (strain DSM 44928 / JCM 14897 / NBRC 102108 / NRRL B-24433 / ID139908) TaxID=479433 RepID=C7Q4G8_CATAD|nr:hypothetical protein [Catenulispora acidiphila]ACU71937.1 hypothetical protein Caci_3028 [Catenulispora acidiphila DSM 44928]